MSKAKVFYTEIDDLCGTKKNKEKTIEVPKDWTDRSQCEKIENQFRSCTKTEHNNYCKLIVNKIKINNCTWYSDTWNSNENLNIVDTYIDVCESEYEDKISVGLHGIKNQDIINWFYILDEFYNVKNAGKYFDIPKYFDKLLEKLPFVKEYGIEIRRESI